MSFHHNFAIPAGWAGHRSRRQIEDEIDEELQFHLDHLAAAYHESGLSEPEAQQQALDRMGDVNKFKHQCRRITMREHIVCKWLALSLLVGVLSFPIAWCASFGLVMLNPTAPFTAVAWDGWAPHVQIEGTWYELLAIDEIPVSEIMSFSRRRFGGIARKRFSQDLGQTLFSMGKFPGRQLELSVRSLQGTRVETLPDVTMTSENRDQVWYNTVRGDPFSQVEWTRTDIRVHLDDRVYRLDSFQGVSADDLLAWRGSITWQDPTFRELFQQMGRLAYLDNIKVQLTDLQTQESLVRTVSVARDR